MKKGGKTEFVPDFEGSQYEAYRVKRDDGRVVYLDRSIADLCPATLRTQASAIDLDDE